MRGQGNAVRSEGNKGQEMKAFFHDRGHLSLGYKESLLYIFLLEKLWLLDEDWFLRLLLVQHSDDKTSGLFGGCYSLLMNHSSPFGLFSCTKMTYRSSMIFQRTTARSNGSLQLAKSRGGTPHAAWRRSTRLQRLWRSIAASEYMYRTRQALWDIKNLSISYISGACEPPIYSLSIPAKNLYSCWLFIQIGKCS